MVDFMNNWISVICNVVCVDGDLYWLNGDSLGGVKTNQKWSYPDSTPIRSVHIAKKYLTFNHRFKIHPAQSNLNLQRILWKILNKMSKIQLSSISRVKISKISILRVLSHFYYSRRIFWYPYCHIECIM